MLQRLEVAPTDLSRWLRRTQVSLPDLRLEVRFFVAWVLKFFVYVEWLELCHASATSTWVAATPPSTCYLSLGLVPGVAVCGVKL